MPSETYVIVYGRSPEDRFAAYKVPTRQDAWKASLRYAPGVPPDANGGGHGYAIETAADVTFSGSLLVGVYNALGPDVPVARFATRTVGVERLLRLLVERAQPLPEPEPTIIEETKMSDATPTTEPVVATARGRAPRFKNEYIFRLTGENPWKDGKKNAVRLAGALALPEPRTVKACVDAGMTTGDIAYLVDHQKATVTDV